MLKAMSPFTPFLQKIGYEICMFIEVGFIVLFDAANVCNPTSDVLSKSRGVNYT
jgi:hypothetical protein